jgi:hypothetical protein
MSDIDVTEVSCEFRQFTPDFEAGAIPFDKLASSETVTKILEPRPTADAPASRRRS